MEQQPQGYEPGLWADYSSLYEDGSAITAVEFDGNYDMVWMGHASGRVAGYSFGADVLEEVQPPSLNRYCSFPSADAISQLLPNHSTVMAVGQSSIKIHSQGGVCLGSMKISGCTATDGGPQRGTFTCADLVRDASMARSSPGYVASSVIAGTSDKGAYLFDLSQGLHQPLLMYNLQQPTVKMLSTGLFLIAAGSDGSLRLLDGGFRSNRITKTLEAHSGSIRDMAVSEDGFTLLTCGTSKRALNPYDTKSPFTYTHDSAVKVFDLRMQRQIAPLPISVPSRGVGFLGFSAALDCDERGGEYATSVVCVTDDGVVQVSSLSPMLDTLEAQQVRLYPIAEYPIAEYPIAEYPDEYPIVW
jgi:hypothetical protein